MKIGLLLISITVWIIFGGLLTLAIIFDGVYIQLIFDFGIMVVSAIIGYYLKGSLKNKQS
ncbi:unnamed protein product [marine sediment metagenome]|uniref:Uncharacterized protein n=1 Tax=marine sediment metagenome TaxID=412755 RepID=X1AVW6_9ZZZZ